MTSRNDIDALFRQIGGTSEYYREFAVPDFAVSEPACVTPPFLPTSAVIALSASQTPPVMTDASRRPAVQAAPAGAGLSDLFNRLAQARPGPDWSGAT